MEIVLNRQPPGNLSMTDTHLLYLADQIMCLFGSNESVPAPTIFVVKRCANKEQIVDNYRVVYEGRFSATVVADWANAEATNTALIAMHNMILAFGT